jgi:aryl-alcohol dehydrogenase-like predicted oxidoreductase
MSLGKTSPYAQSSDYTDDKGIKIVHTALDNGVTMLDTAIAYGNGVNEKLVGQAIKGYDRSKIQVATKTGIAVGADGSVSLCSKPEFIRKTCLESLERLDTPYIDLFYLHRIDVTTPIEESMEEMKKLIAEGKIKYVGLSEASASTIRRAHAVQPLSAIQLEWSLWTRDVEEEIIPTCRELGIGIVVYSPLGRGILTGALTKAVDEQDWRAGNPRFQGENFVKNLEFVQKVTEMAKQKGCTPGQLSLAWVMAQGDDVCPIPGTSNVNHLLENIKASQMALTTEEIEQLKSLVPAAAIAGERYDASMPTFKTN